MKCVIALSMATKNLRHVQKTMMISIKKMTLFIQLMQEKNILSETRLAELNEWQQISEIQFQLDWLENFKKQYIN